MQPPLFGWMDGYVQLVKKEQNRKNRETVNIKIDRNNDQKQQVKEFFKKILGSKYHDDTDNEESHNSEDSFKTVKQWQDKARRYQQITKEQIKIIKDQKQRYAENQLKLRQEEEKSKIIKRQTRENNRKQKRAFEEKMELIEEEEEEEEEEERQRKAKTQQENLLKWKAESHQRIQECPTFQQIKREYELQEAAQREKSRLKQLQQLIIVRPVKKEDIVKGRSNRQQSNQTFKLRGERDVMNSDNRQTKPKLERVNAKGKNMSFSD